MKIVIQRVTSAKCEVEGKLINQIGHGYMILVGLKNGDDEEKVKKMAKKVVNLRIFEDENGKMNLSIKDVCGSILSISQFTLCADTTHGNRPSFIDALKPDLANIYYEKFNEELNNLGIKTYSGVFRADMQISLINDGPVTIIIEE